MNKTTDKKTKINILIKVLKKLYPQAKCFLNYKQPHELLIATRLSAQCTDKKVNEVTKILFKKFSSIDSFANANFNEIYKIIKPCGLGNKKAKDTIKICEYLAKKFNYKIPNTLEKLITLPGVGRKTANLILSTLFKKPAIIVDTHVIRISNRLGLVNTKNPTSIELDLLKIVPKIESYKFCHRLVLFGRNVCRAKNPVCSGCPVSNLCSYLLQ